MSDHYTAVRGNVSTLGSMLGETVRHAEGEAVFEKVEAIRRLAKSARTGNSGAQEELLTLLHGLREDELLPVVRAFSHFLNLANIAEQHQTISRQMEAEASASQTLDDLFDELIIGKVDREDIIDAIGNLNIELVLTAHPTEIARRSLIHKYVEIDQCLSELELQNLSEWERQRARQRLEELIAHLWYTHEFRPEPPTPVDEAKWGLAVVENSLWQALPEFLRRLDNALRQLSGDRLPLDAQPVSFVSWMGGDRDGNPNVTAVLTREVLLLNRWQAADLYLKDINALVAELSMSKSSEEVARLADGGAEPYRVILRRLRALLSNTLVAINAELKGEEKPPGETLWHVDQLWQPLHACYQSLCQCGMELIAEGKLLDVLRRIKCFGVYLVKLDIRQESDRHTQVLSELTQYLALGDYSGWDEDARQDFLLRELQSKRPLLPPLWEPSPETREVLDTCREIARQPREAIASYIISMARASSDVLAVQLLLKETGCPHHLAIVPLFETLDDLNRADTVIADLLHLQPYREAIGGRQMVMIGYSDSAKDAGMLAAGWAQYQAQEKLLKVCADEGVSLMLFHGRGGTVGRGGAPAHAALLSQPPGSLRGGLRVTIQGEMIRAKLGLSALAVKTLALYTSAILQANLEEPPAPNDEWRELMQQLADASCAMYREVVRGDERFVDYFRAATPEQELGNLSLGSRPARRRQSGGIETLRAIPWIFAWSQNRLMLPAWLGAGAAIQQAVDAGKGPLLETMCEQWPFFSTRLSLLEMVFVKADAALSAYYDDRLVNPELRYLGENLRAQLRADIQTILRISNEGDLMDDLPWIRQSVQWRNTYTDPLNFLQAELLSRNREERDEQLEQAIMVTISGIAAGMRNTG